MKLKNLIVGVVGACVVAASAVAQNAGDLYSQYAPLVISSGLIAASTGTTTNNPVDVFGCYGRALVVVNTSTNAGGTVGLSLQSSTDTTNWTYVANAAETLATTTIIYTNMYFYGTNLTATNNWLMPYSVGTTTASSGYVIPARVPNLFTNTLNAVSVTGNGQPYVFGVNLTDNTRYLRTIWTPLNGATNGATYGSVTIIPNRQTLPGQGL